MMTRLVAPLLLALALPAAAQLPSDPAARAALVPGAAADSTTCCASC